MKILYDYQIFDSQKAGGISRYHMDLFKGIRERNPLDTTLSVLYSENQYLRNLENFKIADHFNGIDKYITKDYPLLKLRVQHYLNPIVKMKSSHEQNALFTREQIKRLNPDVFHLTYYNDLYEDISLPPYVITIHDMIFESKPEYFQDLTVIGNKKKLIEGASRIIAVSDFTKQEIIKHYPQLEQSKIDVIYHGIDLDNFHNTKDTSHRARSYFLYIGGRWSYKNFYFMLSALRNILIDNNLKLYCVGTPFNESEKCYLSFLGIEKYVINTGQVSDEKLQSLYMNAIALIYPSLIEGFGIPLLEGMKNSTPLILSDIPVFREVAGDAALYFNPFSISDFLRTVLSLLNSDSLTTSLILKGKQRVCFFTKERMIENTLRCYELVKK